MDEALLRKIEELGEARRAEMAAPGALKLPTLLDRRRLEFGIPDNAFSVQPYMDRLLVWQMSGEEGKKTYGSTGIHMADTVAARRKDEAPRGILLAAGLQAMSILESNGIYLGHTVIFMRAAPFRLRTGWSSARETQVVIIQSGDIVGSEDLRAMLVSGQTEIKVDNSADPFHYLESHPKPRLEEHPDDY